MITPMSTLVLDIETVGEDFDALDETTRDVLLRWVKASSNGEDELRAKTQEVKDGLGFSPLTGSVVAIGILDVERERTAVFYQSPGTSETDQEEDGVKFRPMGEKGMLEEFWRVAAQYDTFVTFNGRGFDIPFLLLRSAALEVRPTRDLMSNRYLGMQRGVTHVDLLDQLSFYGATLRRPSLHLVCRAFGIKSPKADGVCGDDVAGLYKEGRYLDIARYNVGDLIATRDVYRRWQEYLRP